MFTPRSEPRPPVSRCLGILVAVDELASIPIRRNTLLLAASMACLSGMFQLVAAVSSLTFVKVTGFHGLLGLGPAIFLITSAFAAYQAGRGMDRFGRIPVLAVGFGIAALGLVVTGIGTRIVVAPHGDRRVHPARQRTRHAHARAHGRRRHVPTRAPRGGHRAGPERCGRRRRARSCRVRSTALRSSAVDRLALDRLARCRRLPARRPGPRALGATRPPSRGGADRGARATGHDRVGSRTDRRDHPPARRRSRAARSASRATR